MATAGTQAFREARDFLLAHRTDHETAYEKFRWPRLDEFNWALDWFDVLAEGNDDTALRIVEADGGEGSWSYAELSGRSNQVANWLRAPGVRAGDSSCSATSSNSGRPSSPRSSCAR
ncbi:hypothetical protein ACGFIY_08170 [Micromonospora chersina]|uniref:hypothetical protein n=1 Tax=Micromonospora chersina TaxID=47854 RepID=UPI00371D13AE